MGSQIMAYKTLTMRGLFRATLLLLFSFLLVVADNHCPSIMENSRHVTEDFQMIVVHGIHSMTLENLRHYFDSDAPEDNRKKGSKNNFFNKLCPCLKDVESNGVRDMLQQLARKMRDTR